MTDFCCRQKVHRMSYDVGVMMFERDRKRATHLLKRTPSVGKSTTADLNGDQVLGKFEPDWSKFEVVFAKGKPKPNWSKAVFAKGKPD